MKKVALFSAAIIMFGAICMPVNAKIAEPDLKTSAADYYIISEPSAEVKGEVSVKLQNKEEEIIIPEEVSINGKMYSVTEISGLCYPDIADKNLKQDAYKNIKNKVTQIITLPKTIARVQKGTFSNFTNLKEIKVDPNNEYFIYKKGALLSKDGKKLYGTITLQKKYTIPKGVTTIMDRAFAYSKVKTIVLPKTCHNIGARSFYRCSKLSEVKGIKGVKRVGKGAFYGCKIKSR